jgi:predicted transcriptional regulator
MPGVIQARVDAAVPILREWPVTVDELASRLGCNRAAAHTVIAQMKVQRFNIVQKKDPRNLRKVRYVIEDPR